MGDLLNQNIDADDDIFLTSDEASDIRPSTDTTSTPETVEQNRPETVQNLIGSCTQIAEEVRERLAKSHIHVEFADATIERLAQLTCKIVEQNWIPDLLQFAAHAGRTNPNIEDANLIFRRSESVNKRIDSLVNSIDDEAEVNVSFSDINHQRNKSTNIFERSLNESSKVGVDGLGQRTSGIEEVLEAQPQVHSFELTPATTISRPPTIRRLISKVSTFNRPSIPQQPLIPQPSTSRRSNTAPVQNDANGTKTPDWWNPPKHSTPAERRAALRAAQQRAAQQKADQQQVVQQQVAQQQDYQQKTQVISVKRTLPPRPNVPPKRPNLAPQLSHISHPKATSRPPQQER
ncbi:hypothetical protein M3Y94_01024900 [Aphelenchoides besseyi]|nr:hypothetical protein M3Y94_01024900 [Aphelenchoides besseyi]KAI6223850.1 hypothetical protein M3Y95_00820100 [Aphelenchoides besseyi]